jgi:DNA-binding transcriptional MocR family regulator
VSEELADGAHAAPADAATQNVAREGVLELVFGEPDPALFPAAGLARACVRALRDGGRAALPYGANAGPPELRRRLAAHIAAAEARPIAGDDVVITGGSSQALDQILTLFTDPGDVVLVEDRTYSLALGMLRERPLRVVPIPMDNDGLDVTALEGALAALAAEGARPRLLYTVATFHNPTGVCLAAERRGRLVQIAAEHDVLIVEDDVYRDLSYDRPAPASLWSLAPDVVMRLGSFSKTLAPGLRVGWLTASPERLARFAHGGLLESGGCVSQFAASATAAYLADGYYDEHLAGLRTEYRRRRDALADSLTEHLPAGCGFALPGGGFFIWVTLPPGLSGAALLPVAERHGVSFLPAAACRPHGDEPALRLAFSLYPTDVLAEGARRLGRAVGAALAGA